VDRDTEQEIAKGLQKGDRQAWLQLYEACAESLWQNVARLMGYDCSAVPDVVQEAFLAAARSAKNFDSRQGSLWIWLWGIARRRIARRAITGWADVQSRSIKRAFTFAKGLPPESDWHYAGKDATFGDAETAIFWYRPQGSETYRVIYADLSVKDVAPGNLPD
jgi:DNA-directed RNA polymerase specialized sigma24 family protein